MDWKLEVVAIPVSDVDRAKRFYSEQVGFVADHDIRISDEMRVVQLTPPGSACSIVLSTGLISTSSAAGSASQEPVLACRVHRRRARTNPVPPIRRG